MRDQGYTVVPASGGTFYDVDGSTLSIPAAALRARVRVQFTSASRQSFLDGTAGSRLQGAAAVLPPSLTLASPLYLAETHGEMPRYSRWTLMLPRDSESPHLLDLYRWTGTRWEWMPSEQLPDSGWIEGVGAGVPRAVAVMRAERVPPLVRAEAGESVEFVGQSGSALTALSPRLYLLQPQGRIGQLFAEQPAPQASGLPLVPVLHNVEPPGTLRSDLVNDLLLDPAAWGEHVDQISALVAERQYDGLVIDYRGVDPALRDAFTAFITALGKRLAATNKMLVVRVGEPTLGEDSQIETGGYDWQLLGEAASRVQLPVPATATPAQVDALLAQATRRINRYKIEVELSAASYRLLDGAAQPVPFSEVAESLRRAAQLSEEDAPSVEPLEQLRPALEGSGQLSQDPVSGVYRLDSDSVPLFLETRESVARRLARFDSYHVGGVLLRDANLMAPSIWELLATYRDVGLSP